MKRNLFRVNKGVSLIISLGIVWVFMLLAASMAPMIASQMRQSMGYYNYKKAYYAAEAGINAGLYELTHKGTATSGFENFTYDDKCQGLNDGGCAETVTATWKIFKTTDKSYSADGFFSYPIPGTGTAGSTCDLWNPVTEIEQSDNTACEELGPGQGQEWAKLKCSITTEGGLGSILKKKDTPDVDAEITSILADYTDAKDLPCNWNKIKYGETVQIPLYGENGKLTFTEFKLRVRTPCKAVCDPSDGGDDKNCEVPELCVDMDGDGNGDRYVVKEEPFPNPPPPADPAKSIAKSKTVIKDTLILWSIEDGKCTGGFSCFLSNMVNVVSNDASYKEQARSLITAKRMNNKKDSGYTILDGTVDPMEIAIGLLDADPSELLNILNVAKKEKSFLHIDTSTTSFLKLHFAKQAVSDETPDKFIPYLEYQLLYRTDGDTSVITADPLVTSESSVGGFKQSLQARYSPKTGVINYVIQQ